jgi:hypothetical protein
LPGGFATRPTIRLSRRMIWSQTVNFCRLFRSHKRVLDVFFVSTRLFEGKEIYFTRLLEMLEESNVSKMTYTEDWSYTSRDTLVLNPLKAIFSSLSRIVGFFLKLRSNNPLQNRLQSKKIEYILWYHWWNYVVGKIRPKRVSFLTHYFWTPLIQVCREQGVETIELQHGVIGEGIVYRYNHISSNSLILPHKLLLLGSPWKNNIEMRNVSQIITGDFRYKLISQLADNVAQKQYDYYFITQPTIHTLMVSILRFFKNLNWCVCLHPVDKSNLPLLEFLDKMKIDYVIDWSNVLHKDAKVLGSSSMLLLELAGKVKTVTQIIDKEAKYRTLGEIDGFNKLFETDFGWEFVEVNTHKSVEYFEELNYEELYKIYPY